MTLTFLQNYFGLVKIPLTLRTDVKDALIVYTLLKNLSQPKLTFVSFIKWSHCVSSSPSLSLYISLSLFLSLSLIKVNPILNLILVLYKVS